MTMPWSNTSLSMFKKCPWHYHQNYNLKACPKETSEALTWGTQVHEALERRGRDKTPLPPNMTQFEKYAAALEQVTGEHSHELSLGMKKGFSGCAYSDPDAWGRGKLDLVVRRDYEAVVVDFKTGKYRPNAMQPAVSAALVFANYPVVQKITTMWTYIQAGNISKDVFTRSSLVQQSGPFLTVSNDLDWARQHDRWVKRPSGLCGFCPVTTCEHNRKKGPA
jgi:PD-(D/E)XK nuclease superfamily